jgi:hypothetical protein
MGEVRSLDDHRPHVTGPAICLGCKHKWIAVRLSKEEAWDESFECPECHLFKGVPEGLFSPSVGSTRFVCPCGCDIFFVLKDWYMCRNCGSFHND